MFTDNKSCKQKFFLVDMIAFLYAASVNKNIFNHCSILKC